ncbi:cupin domain-containing protein [Baekduia soli]|uniref:Cupin domain-containing protein n=2 Tax=Baekduia soli TaxID=496014 RepID=A0A5B8U4T4_9ACTN|nr:cupin domain-containing protein [Baekduia soli]
MVVESKEVAMSDIAQVPRRHETPNAVMHTYASRALTGTELAVWSVEMEAGATGPVHVVDGEQVIVVIDGELELTLRGETRTLRAGASAVLPAGDQRQLVNRADSPAVTLVSSRSGVRASTAQQDGVPLPWAV